MKPWWRYTGLAESPIGRTYWTFGTLFTHVKFLCWCDPCADEVTVLPALVDTPLALKTQCRVGVSFLTACRSSRPGSVRQKLRKKTRCKVAAFSWAKTCYCPTLQSECKIRNKEPCLVNCFPNDLIRPDQPGPARARKEMGKAKPRGG